MGGVRVFVGTRKGAFVLTSDASREQDLSHEPADAPLPEAVATGREPFLVVGAIAGGQA